MIPASFEYHSPATVKEAVDLLSRVEDAKILAGGQSLVPLMKLRLAKPACLIDLNGIPGLNYVREDGEHILIGPMTRYSEIEESALLQRLCPLLPQTAATVGDTQVRNRGTIGGSIAHADPAGDMPAAVLALDAQFKVVGAAGEKWIRARDFFLGLLTSALEPNELLAEIKVPLLKRPKSAYLKAAQRTSGFAVVGVAVSFELDSQKKCQGIGIGVTGVSDTPYRAEAVEKLLAGKGLDTAVIEKAAAQVTAGKEITEDINGSKPYRSHLAQVYTARAVAAALKS